MNAVFGTRCEVYRHKVERLGRLETFDASITVRVGPNGHVQLAIAIAVVSPVNWYKG